jgi:hypothetical protein
MANIFSQFISDRFIQPAVDARVEHALYKQPVAYGSSVVQEQYFLQDPSIRCLETILPPLCTIPLCPEIP